MNSLRSAIEAAEAHALRERLNPTHIEGYYGGGTQRHVRMTTPNLTANQWRMVAEWLTDIERTECG